jgi:hypothetical protein
MDEKQQSSAKGRQCAAYSHGIGRCGSHRKSAEPSKWQVLSDGDLLSDIYLKISNWNDAKIKPVTLNEFADGQSPWCIVPTDPVLPTSSPIIFPK